MYKLNLTKVQIEHLLFIKNNKENVTITQTARRFECSKVNSKKILDRMIVVGVLYKEENNYKLTDIGKDLADFYDKSLEKNKYLFEKLLNVGEETAEKVSIDLMTKENTELEESIDRKFKILKRINDFEGPIVGTELSEILPQGRYKLDFIIKKADEEINNSFIEDSMAIKGFETGAYLNICKESYIELFAKTINKAQGGYLKKGIATKLFFYEKGQEVEIDSKNKTFKIPLSIIDYWSKLDGLILMSSLHFTIKAQVGINTHSNVTNFIFVVNLCSV
jgi:hypothetical protein